MIQLPILVKTDLPTELQKELENVRLAVEIQILGEKPASDHLVYDNMGLSLNDRELGSLHLDFLSSSDYVRKSHRGKSELIAKAVGLPKGPQKILDATAGLAQDAWFLTQLGAQVEGCERSPVIFLLLADAGLRAGNAKLKIHFGDSVSRIRESSGEYTVIYLDPMFPEKKKSALPRKEMQIFRKWVGEDADSQSLWTAAMESKAERVVVKRPLKAPPLAPGVIHSFEGTTVRYDLYTPLARRG